MIMIFSEERLNKNCNRERFSFIFPSYDGLEW
jgi:hypothetical protein